MKFVANKFDECRPSFSAFHFKFTARGPKHILCFLRVTEVFWPETASVLFDYWRFSKIVESLLRVYNVTEQFGLNTSEKKKMYYRQSFVFLYVYVSPRVFYTFTLSLAIFRIPTCNNVKAYYVRGNVIKNFSRGPYVHEPLC